MTEFEKIKKEINTLFTGISREKQLEILEEYMETLILGGIVIGGHKNVEKEI